MKKGRLKKFLAGTAMGLCALAMPFGLVGCDKEDDINVRFADNYFQWQVEGSDEWNNVISINELKTLLGDGYKGDPGNPSVDGREVEFQTTDTHIQWRYKTEDNSDEWKNLIEVSAVKQENKIAVNLCYHLDGGVNPVENTNVKYLDNSNMLDLAIPTKSGYSFVDWYTDETYTEVFNGVCSEDIQDNKTICLYAKWTDDYVLEGTIFKELTNKTLDCVELPTRVTEIYDSAFQFCTALESVKLNYGINKIGYRAFYQCTSLKSINIPNTVKEIGNSAFSDCSSLVNIYIPNSVEIIGNLAFRDCVSLKSIYIPSSVVDIKSNAFENCYNLESIEVSQLNAIYTDCRKGVFGNDICYNVIVEKETKTLILACKNSDIIAIDIDYIGEYAFSCCKDLESIILSNGVLSIGERAFSSCENLEKITIPNSVTSIGMAALSNLHSLTEIIFKGTQEEWESIDIDESNTKLLDGTITIKFEPIEE